VRPLKIQQTGGMARLTPREREVVRLVADGMKNQEIAFELNLTTHISFVNTLPTASSGESERKP
jgi:FixJ family two-component response regulator